MKGKKKSVGGLPSEVTEYAYWSRFLVNRRFAYFVKGEKYCVRCEYVFKPTWMWDRCPSCGLLLRRTPRHNKKWKSRVSWAPDKVVRE